MGCCGLPLALAWRPSARLCPPGRRRRPAKRAPPRGRGPKPAGRSWPTWGPRWPSHPGTQP
eukprot:9534355-Lingulodinium_polyedra.AAC.1